ncbi:MAG: hypothetical protein V4759_14540 [Pseudomonadota bacterium]
MSPANGGELTSLQVKRDGRWVELIYRARDYTPTQDWAGRAPVLWPATGRTLEPNAAGGFSSSWTFAGERREIPIHGFVRDRPWVVERRSSGEVVLSLADDSVSRRMYPFGFRIRCKYRVVPAGLEMNYEVRASAGNRAEMPFSIGNHITFRIPLVPGSPRGDLTVATPATMILSLDESGRPTGAAVPDNSFATGRPLSDLPKRKAISLSGYKGDPSLRIGDPSGLTVEIAHKASQAPSGTPVSFNLWGDMAEGFFSPQPWVGRQNSLVTGDGLIKLKPGKSFRWTVMISVSDTEASSSPSSHAGAHND